VAGYRGTDVSSVMDRLAETAIARVGIGVWLATVARTSRP
jgi:hypothetical protein